MSREPDSSFGSFAMTDLSDHPTSLGISRRSSRHGSFTMLTSKPLAETAKGHNQSKAEEKVSILDPKRFTPTLHANLVSEILSLRREVENKNNTVLSLEESLSSTKDENAKLHDEVADNAKQNRLLRHQMEMLEGGTLAALEELALERDASSQTLTDVKKRLDASQKKVRSQEEEAEKMHTLWESDRQRWDLEKRNLDRKVHVAEGRLKTLLSEMEASQARSSHAREKSWSGASGSMSFASRHRDSITTIDGAEARNLRPSSAGESLQGTTGATLADELEFNDDDDNIDDPLEDDFASPEALPEEIMHRFRPASAQSHRASLKARKLLGLVVDDGDEQCREQSHARSNSWDGYGLSQLRVSADYVDSSTQDSAPSSPTSPLQQALATIDEVEGASSSEEINANRRDQDAANMHAGDAKSAPKGPGHATTMVSSASQTMEQPLSPPATPVDGDRSFPPAQFAKVVEMSSSSTQTNDEEVPSLSITAASRDDDHLAARIPVIAIRPPSSGSARDGVVLPPHTRNASCQAAVPINSTRSISIQTEEIRIDPRTVKLPPHLLPSSISSDLPSPSTEAPRSKSSKTVDHKVLQQVSPSPPIKPPRMSSDTDVMEKALSSLESDSEQVPDVEAKEDDGDLSDDSFGFGEPVRKVLSKVQNSWKLVPKLDEPPNIDRSESADVLSNDSRSAKASDTTEKPHAHDSISTVNTSGKSAKWSNGKPEEISPKSFTSSSITMHTQRSRSPSLPTVSSADKSTARPPFPVPDRSSSKNIPWNRNDEDGSPIRGKSSFFGKSSRRKDQGRPPVKKPPVLRKIRSSSTTQTETHSKTWSSQTQSPSSPFFHESPLSFHPPLPNDLVSSPYTHPTKQTSEIYRTKSVPSISESAVADQTSVVDAIAQTMVGEWMWKYVRRRKSFGLPESAATEFENGRNDIGASAGARHQRWVWLAPYEGAVMWSSKQPTSESALMGKSGRKRKPISTFPDTVY